MPPLRLKKKSRYKAPATVIFYAPTEQDVRRPQVFVRCHYSGKVVGPIYGQKLKSIRKALVELTKKCDCGRRYHTAKDSQGTPLEVS